MKQFTIVMAVRDTDKEYNFLKRSLPSAIKLNPGELIIGLDKPASQRLSYRIKEIVSKYNFKSLRLLEIEKTHDWNFQLAHIFWEAYKIASNDYILSFDADSILKNNVMIGLDQIGQDNIAVVSFTKQLRIKSFGELVRYIFYRIRVRQSDYVFSGIYWIYRPYYFDSVKLEKYKKIYNGIDTIMCNEILAQKKYKIITRKEIGVKCLDIQNEDLPWRQFQTGVWIRANEKNFRRSRLERLQLRRQQFEQREYDSFSRARNKKSLFTRRIRLGIAELRLNLIEKANRITFIEKSIVMKYIETRPLWFLIVKSVVYAHPHMVEGYLWAKHNPHSEAVQVASGLDSNEWALSGSKYLNHKKWKIEGTGYVKSETTKFMVANK